MKDQKKLLVLLDGSERAMRTIEYLQAFTPLHHMRMVLFHVFTGVPESFLDLENQDFAKKAMAELTAWEKTKKDEINAFMDQAVGMLVEAGIPKDLIEVRIHHREAGIARDILKEAAAGYDALVLRRRGAGALEGITIGSVAEKLLGKVSFLPIMVAGQKPQKKRILIAVDGSDASFNAVSFTADLLGGHGYVVRLLNVIRGFGGIMSETSDFMMPNSNFEAARSEMEIFFEKAKKRLVEGGIAPEDISEKIITGVYSRAGAIVKEAEIGEFSTIAVGRRGLSKVQEFYMGRVSNKVLHVGRRHTVWVI